MKITIIFLLPNRGFSEAAGGIVKSNILDVAFEGGNATQFILRGSNAYSHNIAVVNLTLNQELLNHRKCKPDFLCSWPSLNSYLK